MLQAVYRTDAVSIPPSVRVERIGIQRYPPAPLKPSKNYTMALFPRQTVTVKSHIQSPTADLLISQGMRTAKVQRARTPLRRNPPLKRDGSCASRDHSRAGWCHLLGDGRPSQAIERPVRHDPGSEPRCGKLHRHNGK